MKFCDLKVVKSLKSLHRYRWWFGGALLIVMSAVLAWSAVGIAVDQRQDKAAVAQREADTQARLVEATDQREYITETVRVLCEKLNALPVGIGRAIAISEEIRAVIGSTTTVPAATLTAEEQQQIDELRAELLAIVQQLGRPIACT